MAIMIEFSLSVVSTQIKNKWEKVSMYLLLLLRIGSISEDEGISDSYLVMRKIKVGREHNGTRKAYKVLEQDDLIENHINCLTLKTTSSTSLVLLLIRKKSRFEV